MGGLIAVMAIVYFLFGNSGPSPATLTKERLDTLQTAVIEYADKHQALPTTLEDLGLAKEALIDHAGVPFVYQAEGSKVVILSYGADGKPGGHSFRADKSVSFNWPTN